MKVKFLTENALETLRNEKNWPLFEPTFKCSTNRELLTTLQEFLQEEPLKETDYYLPDDLILDPTCLGRTELPGVRAVYEALKGLPRSIASDARFWSGLCIDMFWPYVCKRWLNKGVSASTVRDHFLFMGQSKKAYTRNALARLWWIGDLTVDYSRKNPYEITEFVLQDTDYVVNILERNYSNNRGLVMEYVGAVERARSEGYDVRRKENRELCKFLNLLGGVYVLDALPKGMVYTKIYQKAISISEKH